MAESYLLYEDWFQAPLSNPFLIAFQAGRLSNFLGWTMARHALLDTDESLNDVESLLNRLITAAHQLEAFTPGASVLAEGVLRSRRIWTTAMENEAYERWREQIADQPELWYPHQWDGSPQVREAFGAMLDAAGKEALLLGWHLDRAIRPMPPSDDSLSEAERTGLRKRLHVPVSSFEPTLPGVFWRGSVQRHLNVLGIRFPLPIEGPDYQVVSAIDHSLRCALTDLWNSRAPTAPAEGEEQKIPQCTHTKDFVSVVWYGRPFAFDKGMQAKCVEILWNVWNQNQLGLSEKEIGERAGFGGVRFELSKIFRKRLTGGGSQPHPAWGTMIKRISKGVFGLYPPKGA